MAEVTVKRGEEEMMGCGDHGGKSGRNWTEGFPQIQEATDFEPTDGLVIGVSETWPAFVFICGFLNLRENERLNSGP